METKMELRIAKVNTINITEFSSILLDAAKWMISKNFRNWDPSDFTAGSILERNDINELFLCYYGCEAVGCLKLQSRDNIFWPDDPWGEALYVHKLAVRREFAGKGISAFMLDWAKEQAKSRGCRYLRLDCIADRKKLCDIYEKQNFVKIDERLVFGKYPSAFFEIKV